VEVERMEPVQRRNAGSDAAAALDAGRAALRRGAWGEADAAFANVVQLTPDPDPDAAEAWAGIGLGSYWRGDAAAAIAAHERAFDQYRRLGRKAAAARIALWLADTHLAFLGGYAVANGWIEQAARLLADATPLPEHAWLLAYRGHVALHIDGDAQQALELARRGQEMAAAIDAYDAGAVLTALEGLALLRIGDVGTGMARLDEASAAAVSRGPADLNAVAWACCYLVSGCESLRDLPRAAEWCHRVLAFCEQWGLAPVYATCRVDYATVLTWRGEWAAAEAVLDEAAAGLAPGVAPAIEHVRAIRLGELRRRQGRLVEAEQLLRAAGEDPPALTGCAATALDGGEPALALELSERALRLLPREAWLERVDPLAVRVRALAALGRPDDAAADIAELAGAAERGGTALLRGTAATARATSAAAAGDLADAERALENAVAHHDRGGAPYEAAQARLDLAAVLARSGRHATAAREVAHAAHMLQALGARHAADRANALLRELSAARRQQQTTAPLTRREMEVLRLVARGWSNGRIAGQLCVSPHTIKRHIANILRKLDVPSRAAAVAQGSRLGILG
jgi:LuxR family transcriptional regulator, maltose regulon positive regulatory protein